MAREYVKSKDTVEGKFKVNPEIKVKLKKWERIDSLMEDDEEAYKDEPFIHQLPNERPDAYQRRRRHFPLSFINMEHDLISAPADQIFKNGLMLEFENPDGMLAAFAKNVTLGNDKYSFKQWLRDYIAIQLRAYGTVITVIDKPADIPKSRLDERENGMPYLNNIKLQDVVNWEIVNGELVWFMYKRLFKKPWLNPIDTEREVEQQYVLLTQNEMFVLDGEGKNLMPPVVHNFGFVPVAIQASFLPTPQHLIGTCANEQTSRLIISYNDCMFLAKYDAEKHGPATRVMPETARTAENTGINANGEPRLKTQGDGDTLWVDGDERTAPFFLTKEMHLEELVKLAEIYRQEAIENERDLKSVIKKGSSGQAYTSGIAKMIDREPLEANLISLAEDCEHYSRKVFAMVASILDVEDDSKIEFDKDYDLRTLQQKFDEIKLAGENDMQRIMPTGYRELYKETSYDIARSEGLREIMHKEVDEADLNEAELEKSLEEELKRGDMAATAEVETE